MSRCEKSTKHTHNTTHLRSIYAYIHIYIHICIHTLPALLTVQPPHCPPSVHMTKLTHCTTASVRQREGVFGCAQLQNARPHFNRQQHEHGEAAHRLARRWRRKRAAARSHAESDWLIKSLRHGERTTRSTSCQIGRSPFYLHLYITLKYGVPASHSPHHTFLPIILLHLE